MMSTTKADENLILGPLSGDEIDLVKRNRERLARYATPKQMIARLVAWALMLAFLGLLALSWYQAIQITQHGFNGEFPAPLSWGMGAVSFVKAL